MHKEHSHLLTISDPLCNMRLILCALDSHKFPLFQIHDVVLELRLFFLCSFHLRDDSSRHTISAALSQISLSNLVIAFNFFHVFLEKVYRNVLLLSDSSRSSQIFNFIVDFDDLFFDIDYLIDAILNNRLKLSLQIHIVVAVFLHESAFLTEHGFLSKDCIQIESDTFD